MVIVSLSMHSLFLYYLSILSLSLSLSIYLSTVCLSFSIYLSDNLNNTEQLLLSTADATKASENFLDNGQLFLDFNQNDVGHTVVTPAVVPAETDSRGKDSFYYLNGALTETPGTIIALEPVELSDENDSDAPLLGTSLDSLETVGVESAIPLNQNSNHGLSDGTNVSMIDTNRDKIEKLESQENSLYNGPYVGSTGSDIPLLGTSPDSEKSSTEDINFSSAMHKSTEPLVNPLTPSDPHYGYQQSSSGEPSVTFYTQAEPSFVSPYVGSSQASDAPLLAPSLVNFETAESTDIVNKNENPIFDYADSNRNTEAITFPHLSQLPSEPTNSLLAYLEPDSDKPERDNNTVCESQDIFQEAELRQFQEAEHASCSRANNQIKNASVVNSVLVCGTSDAINVTLGMSYDNEDSDTPLLDLSPSVSLEEKLDRDAALEGPPAETLVADIPAEDFSVDQILNNQPTSEFENVDETKNDIMKTFTKQTSTDSSAPLIEEKSVKQHFSDLEIPPNYRVIECEPSFNMNKTAPFLHLYGSSKLLSNPHCASQEHVNLSEACIHMLNHLNNSYSNMSLMQISSLKDIRDIHLEKLDSGPEEEEEEVKPGKHWKNLFAYSIGFMVMYMAFGSLRHLQSSLNSEAGVGLMTLSCLFAFFVIGSLFASYVVKKLEPRNATLVTVLFHLLYVISNCYPKVYILMPVSALLGFWNAVSWGASGTYIQRLACNYAMKTNQKTEHVCSKFHGIFYLIVFFSEVFGNLISSVILGSNSSVPVLISPNNTSFLVNQTTSPVSENFSSQYAHCGVSYSHSDDTNTDTVPVDQTTIYVLTAVFAGMDIIAFFIIFFCVDPLTLYYRCETATDVKSCWQVWQDVKSVLIFMTDWRFILLVPLYMFSAIHIGYISAEITKAFVTCFLGIHMVGYMMICYGISDAFSSYITGWLNQITGRLVLISIGSLLFQLIIMSLLLWQPDSSSLIPFILIFAFWGLSDGFYASQLCSLTGVMFSETCEEAFSAYRMMQGVGLTIAYSYAPVLPLDIKLYMLSGLGIFFFLAALRIDGVPRQTFCTDQRVGD
ncbi:unnamed protein product [Acanthosepion pharaonis]|uniref:UNC93-like protein n=1 Tax=Acanthosepion pharaonis TaxID=158019 RepID=A0A812BD74_ACAPH|nr:unnamed protein product [Sepia pharaonis]